MKQPRQVKPQTFPQNRDEAIIETDDEEEECFLGHKEDGPKGHEAYLSYVE